MKIDYQDHLCQEALAKHAAGNFSAIYSQVARWKHVNYMPWLTVWMARMWAASPFSMIVRGVTAEPFADYVFFAKAVAVGAHGIIQFRPATALVGLMLADCTMKANKNSITEPGVPIWLALTSRDPRWWPEDAVV